MFVPRHNLYLAGIWLFWLALFLIWVSQPVQALRWVVIFNLILFVFVSGNVWGIARYRQTNLHPLFDQVPGTKEPGKWTEKRKEYERPWRKDKKVYELIAPLRDGQGLSWNDIKARVETELGIDYPSSIDTLKAIYVKGKQGTYDSFEKFLENS